MYQLLIQNPNFLLTMQPRMYEDPESDDEMRQMGMESPDAKMTSTFNADSIFLDDSQR